MSSLYYKSSLSLSFNINESIYPKHLNVPADVKVLEYKEIITDDSLNIINSLGLEIIQTAIFFMPPSPIRGPLHRDGDGTKSDLGALNIVVNDNTDWDIDWREVQEEFADVRKRVIDGYKRSVVLYDENKNTNIIDNEFARFK